MAALVLLTFPCLFSACLSTAEADAWRLKRFLTRNRRRASQHLEMTMLGQYNNSGEVRDHMIYRMNQDRELQWSLDRYARHAGQREDFIRRLADLALYDNRQRVHHHTQGENCR